MLENTKLDDFIVEELKNNLEHEDVFMEEIINQFNETQNPKIILSALRHLVKAEGVSKIAKKTGLTRETFYKSLSSKGNPRMDTLFSILKALGCKFLIDYNHKHA